MDKTMLYNSDDCCKICGRSKDDDHEPECPGGVIDSLRIRVSYAGPNCTRGCCGYTDGCDVVDSVEEAVATAAAMVKDCHRYSVSWAWTASDSHDLYAEVEAKIKANDEAENLRREAAAEAAEEERRQQRLAALELERPDLTPEAYARKKEALGG